MPGFAAVILAGGAGRRLGGVDKGSLTVAGKTLLERALESVAKAPCRVVVGPPRSGQLPPDVVDVCEDPPGGGPVAAIEAGLVHVVEDIVVVLACDMPMVTPVLIRQLVERLRTAVSETTDGVLLVDEDGGRQPLAAAYRTGALRRAVSTLPATRGAAVKAVLDSLRVVEVRASGGAALDCDTWDSVAACREQLEAR